MTPEDIRIAIRELEIHAAALAEELAFADIRIRQLEDQLRDLECDDR